MVKRVFLAWWKPLGFSLKSRAIIYGISVSEEKT